MADIPEVSYAKTREGLNIAYQVLGQGPPDLIFVSEWFEHLYLRWEEPRLARFLNHLASVARVVLFDKRGVGLSDPVALDDLPSLESWADDVLAVMDCVGCERTALVAPGSGGPMAIAFAAMHPERTTALVLINSMARSRRSEDYPWAATDEILDAMLATFARGEPPFPEAQMGADAQDERFLDWWKRMVRTAVSPGAQYALAKMIVDLDVRQILPALQVPTLVIHNRGDQWTRVGHGRFLAEHIRGAKYVELEDVQHQYFLGHSEEMLDRITEFVAGHRAPVDTDRVLATVVFTDIVDSTRHAARLSDRSWRELLDRYDDIVDRELARYRGQKVKATGDGTLASFDGPARAVRWARAVADEVHGLGLSIRSGLHVGEIEVRRDNDVAGIAVHVAQRIQALAQSDEVLVSRTVVDLVAGSGLEFDDRGAHELKGVPGTWQLFCARA